jgi:ADP-heptose:LPS heptosyltransferase
VKILVISLAGIGDTLIATPLIHELRLLYPDATLDALVLWPGAQQLLEGNPWLNTVYQQNFFQVGRRRGIRYLLQLRKNRYDLTFNTHPQSKIQYRVAAWMIHARQRLSHAYDNFTPLDRLLVNRTLPQDYSVHSLDNNLRLLSLVDRAPTLPAHEFELYLSPAEIQAATDLAVARQLDQRRVIGVHVGSGKTKNLELKRWPVENWITLFRRLTQARPDLTFLLFGGPEEKAENESVLRQVQHPNVVAPYTRSIREAAALLRHCEAFISVDNALMHLAVTMKVPRQIIIESPTFGPTLAPYRPFTLVENPAVHGRNLDYYRYDGQGIRGSREELIQCMKAVTVDAVCQKLIEAMDAPRPKPG